MRRRGKKKTPATLEQQEFPVNHKTKSLFRIHFSGRHIGFNSFLTYVFFVRRNFRSAWLRFHRLFWKVLRYCSNAEQCENRKYCNDLFHGSMSLTKVFQIQCQSAQNYVKAPNNTDKKLKYRQIGLKHVELSNCRVRKGSHAYL